MATEAAIVNRICANLKRRGIYFEKTHGDPMSRRGRPDLMVIVDGRAFFLEVKRSGCKPTALQAHRIEQLRKAGAVAEVVHSWEEVAVIMHLLPEGLKHHNCRCISANTSIM